MLQASGGSAVDLAQIPVSQGGLAPEPYGKYELLATIGAGGMAEVFLAKTRGAEGFEKIVVIKRILHVWSKNKDFKNAFISEANLAAKLRHANIVQVLDFNLELGRHYLAMEWIDGTDLRKALSATTTLPVPLAITIAKEILAALHYAHTSPTEAGKPLRLIHRDVSPDNVLISVSGEVKLTDFGIAKLAAVTNKLTKTGFFKGKAHYCAPEQVSGQVDERTDLFSLGLLLWEALAGTHPYQGSNPYEILEQAKRADILPIDQVAPSVPAPLGAIISKLLQRDPEKRFVSAGDVLDALLPLSQNTDARALAAFVRKIGENEANNRREGRNAQNQKHQASRDTDDKAARFRRIKRLDQQLSAPRTTLHLPQSMMAAYAAHKQKVPSSQSHVLPRRTPVTLKTGFALALIALLAAGAFFWIRQEPTAKAIASANTDRAKVQTSVPQSLAPLSLTPAPQSTATAHIDLPKAPSSAADQPGTQAKLRAVTPSSHQRRRSLGFGLVDFIMLPMGDIILPDGTITSTPLLKYRLAGGWHSVVFKDKQCKWEKKIRFQVKANEHLRLRKDLGHTHLDRPENIVVKEARTQFQYSKIADARKPDRDQVGASATEWRGRASK